MRVRAAVLIILVIGALTSAKLLLMRGASTPKRGKSTSDNRKPARSPLSRDFGALDNLTLGYCGTWRLTEAEIEFETIEPG